MLLSSIVGVTGCGRARLVWSEVEVGGEEITMISHCMTNNYKVHVFEKK